MHWKLKSLALHAVAHSPASVTLHRWLNRATGRYFDEVTEHVVTVYGYHARNLFRLADPSASRALEFGAGRSLLTSLLLSAAGAGEVLAYDVASLATVDQVNAVIRQLRERVPPHAGRAWREITDTAADLQRQYGIRYCAPGDARRTELPSGSIDLICSTSTLEHIPREEIVDIMHEARRVGSSGGLVSFIIDYHDHYASSDSSITRFNFYRYSEKDWKRFNPPNHFQNRLRHSDYERLFSECGFAIVEGTPVIRREDVDALRRVPLSPAFARYSEDDLLASNGFFLLKALPAA